MRHETAGGIIATTLMLTLAPAVLRAEPVWRPMDPPSRNISAMAYDARRAVCVLFGGQDDLRTYRALDDTWEWDGARWRQRRFPDGPPARGAHAMACDEARGRVVLFGGVSADNALLADTWTYDGNKWSLAATDGPPPQAFHAMVYDSAEEVVVLVSVDGVWTWDGAAWAQRSTALPPRMQGEPALAFDRDRKVIVLYVRGDFDRMTWEWDGAEWTERTHSIGPLTERPIGMTYDFDRRVTVLTGVSEGALRDFETWEWDGTTWRIVSQSKTDPAPSETLVYDAARGVTVSFGTHTTEWDGIRWRPRGPGPRMLHAMTYDAAREEVLVFGGARLATTGSGNVYLRDLWSLTRRGWTLLSDEGPVPRYGPSMSFDSDRGIAVMFGGRDATREPLNDTWAWDGAQWTLLSDEGPANVLYSSMAYDKRRDVIVMHVDDAFVSNSPTAQTWEWDGGHWTLRDSGSGAGREFAKVIYDAAVDRTLAYGLESRNVWQWDGQRWAVSPTAGPLMDQLHSMVYDSARGVSVTLDGGAFPQQVPRTWAWDGAAWLRTDNRLVDAPRTHAAGAMAYDASRDLVVFHGGFQARMFGDTWILREPMSADFDDDDDVDIVDFATFAQCFNGDGFAPSEDCPRDAVVDFDDDGDVDLADFAGFVQRFTGSR